MNIAATRMPSRAPARTRRIADVIAQLDDIIAWSMAERSRLGFFATLYRNVTIKVGEGIAQGRFDDGPRMERLDVIFADRYVEAFDRYHRHETTSRCWEVAFAAAAQRRPVIVQHLLLGMNAHINFDLGIAVAEASRGQPLSALRRDFDRINDILMEAVPNVIRQIGSLSPLIGHLERINPDTDHTLINFSLVKARAFAWQLGEELTTLRPAQWPRRLAVADHYVTALGNLLERPPSLTARATLTAIRASESGNVQEIIGELERTSP